MRDRWSTPSVALHWLAATLIVGLATAGFVMTNLPTDSTGRLLMSRLHTFSGATLMVVTVARLVVRRRGPAVAPLPVSDLHRRGVGVVHGLLYAVTFALGASGFVTGARSAWPDYLGGHLTGAPPLEALASRQAHEVLVFALLGLVLVHVAGVMLQQVRGGGVLARMAPWAGPTPRPHERDAR
ncbi:MAG TPA: cytochrome b/b6 domain-containing protein [Polyangiaceae bacterium]|jgi:cytochrome b561|nr:cytochrome b/b6 domain-containing protein [Polyangiaceae bacterium]